MGLYRWAPAGIFALGSLLTLGIDGQRHLTLEQDLGAAVSSQVLGLTSIDVTVPEKEVEIAGVDTYLMRAYTAAEPDAAVSEFNLYVGFYGSQAQGRTIHSPKNCLPGGGWEPIHSREERIALAGSTVPVNRYVLQRGDERVLVLYWYQGRGRIVANEYLVKLDLLKDSALYNRTDEALVRIVVPVDTTEDAAFEAAARIAAEVVPMVYRALPA